MLINRRLVSANAALSCFEISTNGLFMLDIFSVSQLTESKLCLNMSLRVEAESLKWEVHATWMRSSIAS